MTLALRVLRGARAGITERFDSPVVSLGRHPTSDFRFDPEADLDVSARHAELRANERDGHWTIHDLGSTNGTFVNEERVSGSRRLRSGDVIGFGPSGPRVEVLLSSSPIATALPTDAPPRRDTTARVAEAVEAQMAGVKRTAAIAVVVLAAAAALGIAWTQRQSRQREAALLAVIARIEQSSAGLQRAVADMRPRDSAFATLLAGRAAETQRSANAGRSAASAGGGGGRSGASLAAVAQGLEREAATQQSLSRVDFAHVHDLNEPAVGMLASDLDGSFIAGTAFAVSRGGLLVTNRHMVQTSSGQPARRLRVIFSNTRDWLPAHVVRVSAGDDLALLQLDEPSSHPPVSAVSRDGAAARVGAPVLSIGYPLAVGTPMEGAGLSVTARSTTAAGTVSKRLDDVLQIDSYAGKGSSGSPVFDAAGAVVGVIYGGAPESNGRIVYAVPAERLVRFLGGDGGAVVR